MQEQPTESGSQRIESLQQRLLRRKKQIRVYCPNCRVIVFHFPSHIQKCIQRQREADLKYLNQIKTFPHPIENKKRLSIWKYSFDPTFQEEVRKERIRFQTQTDRGSVIQKLRSYTEKEGHQQEQSAPLVTAQDLSVSIKTTDQ